MEENKITSPEFDAWALSILVDNPVELENVFNKYGIYDTPTPRNIMLGAVKFGEPFMQEIANIKTPPILNASGNTGWFETAMSVGAGVATASQVFKKQPVNSDVSPKVDKEKEDGNIDILGLKIEKTYLFLGLGVVVLTVMFFASKRV